MPLPDWTSKRCPVIGMLHAPPLPGSPEYCGDLATVRQLVLRDAEALLSGGVDGLMLENFGDSPFYPNRVPAMTIAALTAIACDLRDLRARFGAPLGINVLRNDGQSALAVALASGASFIRVNVLCGVRVADQGLLQAIAHDLLRDRTNLRAKSIRIWADVDVKHSAPLVERAVELEVRDLIDRGKADAIIVTGCATGEPIDLSALRSVKAAASSAPVLLGSGVTTQAIQFLAPHSDGIIVGSSLKHDGIATNPVDRRRVEQLVEAVRHAT